MASAGRCLVAAHLERLHPGRFLEQLAALLGPQRERGIHGALADDHQLVRTQPAAGEQLHHVPQPRPAAVDEVFRIAGPIRAPRDRDLLELDRQPPVVVVEGEDDLGHADRFPALGAGKDHVVGSAGPEGSVRLLAEHPADGIGHVALAAAVGPDDRGHAGLEDEPGRLGEALEAVELELLQAGHAPTSATCSSAAWAACSSARWRLLPDPVASRSDPITTATVNCWAWAGPWDETSSYIGRTPRYRWLHSWSRLFADFSASARSAVTRRAAEQRPEGRLARVETVAQVDRADEGLECGREQGWAACAAGAQLTAAEAEVSVQRQLLGQAGEGRAVDEGCPVGGEATFIGVGKTLVQQPADDQAQDRVAQELEALVVARDQPGILVGVRRMDERLINGRRIPKDDAESLTQLVDGG